jgi:hypothetical protein
MIWIALAALGVPIWFCALAVTVLVLRNRSLRTRPGDIPVRLRSSPGKRWQRGHGVWIHDVFAFRGSPAAWHESLVWVSEASISQASETPKHLGDEPVIVRLEGDGEAVTVAARGEHRDALLGPYAALAP